MKINIFPIVSSLHKQDKINEQTKLLLEELFDLGNHEFNIVELDELYNADLSLILIQSGGSEQLFLNNLSQLKEPFYLLTYGNNNSLAASLEILSFIKDNNLKGEVLHGSTSYLVKRINEQIECKAELESKIYLFQGLPKKDKMELIVQKAVELGAYEIVPVNMKRSIVKIDNAKKEQARISRWQTIADEASKQSRRGILPKVHGLVSYKEALSMAKNLDIVILPYELAKDMSYTRRILSEIEKGKSIGIFIGPEGGFDDDEIEQANECGFKPITLGNRILRTETAGLAILAMLVYELE